MRRMAIQRGDVVVFIDGSKSQSRSNNHQQNNINRAMSYNSQLSDLSQIYKKDVNTAMD